MLAAVAGGVVVGSGTWLSIEQGRDPLDIDVVLSTLDGLMNQNSVTTGEWNLYQLFTHCAQSVEYSMVGYPQHKPDLFKSTAGKAAFSLFISKRRMTHALNEPIPGAPALSVEGDVREAFERFKQSLIDFKAYEGALAPHFAYGALTKAQYEMAHVMHFNNHLQEIA